MHSIRSFTPLYHSGLLIGMWDVGCGMWIVNAAPDTCATGPNCAASVASAPEAFWKMQCWHTSDTYLVPEQLPIRRDSQTYRVSKQCTSQHCWGVQTWGKLAEPGPRYVCCLRNALLRKKKPKPWSTYTPCVALPVAPQHSSMAGIILELGSMQCSGSHQAQSTPRQGCRGSTAHLSTARGG